MNIQIVGLHCISFTGTLMNSQNIRRVAPYVRAVVRLES